MLDYEDVTYLKDGWIFSVDKIRNTDISILKKKARELFGAELPKGKERIYFHRLVENYIIDCEENPMFEQYDDEKGYVNESI